MAINETLVIKADLSSLSLINEKLEANLELAGASFGLITKIELMVEEIFVNIANYAYGDKEGDATIIFSISDDDPKVLELSFIDSGTAYNPLEKEMPDISLSAEDRGIGGLGIFLYKTLADDISYKREDGKNILTVKKILK